MCDSVGILEHQKCTGGMRECLDKLSQLLRCPLCNKIFEKPTTLASCAHSFCVACIDEYCCDAWVCPVKGCGMPMSIVGGHGGSYRKINPQLAQTVESLKNICESLGQAPDDWWSTTLVKSSLAAANDKHVHKEKCKGDDESDEEEMVDLQRYQAPIIEESSDEEGGCGDWE